MKAKICFNNETHRLSKLPEDLEALSKLVTTIFLTDLPHHWSLEYLDPEGDRVMLADNQDYLEFIRSFSQGQSGTVTTKIFIVPQGLSRSSMIRYVEKNIDASQDLKEQSSVAKNAEPVSKSEDIPKPSEDSSLKVAASSEQIADDQAYIEKIVSEAISSITEEVSKTSIPQVKEEEELKPKTESTVTVPEVKPVEQVCPQAPKKPVPAQKPASKPAPKPAPKPVQKKVVKAVVNQKVLDDLINKAVEKNIAKIATMTQDYISKKNNAPSKQEVPAVIQEQKPEEKVIHKYVRCDGCKKYPLEGARYKCSVCRDFDFCESCEHTKDHEHAFIKIKTPTQPFSHAILSSSPEYMKCPYFQKSLVPVSGSVQVHCAPVCPRKVDARVQEPEVLKKESVVEAEPVSVKEEQEVNREEEKSKKEEVEPESYSKDVHQKALSLKNIFPNQELEALLAFVANAPEDLDLNELAENFRF